MSDVSSDKYNLLDAFRGLGILWIVCYHILGDVREHYGFILNFIIRYGYLGVSIFFVISGYGISSSLHRTASKPLEPRLFLWRRLKRIYPLYLWHLLFAAVLLPLIIAAFSFLRTHVFSLNLAPYTLPGWLGFITLTKVFTSTSWSLNLSFDPLNGAVWFIAILVQIYFFVTFCLLFRKKASFLLFTGFIASCLALIPQVEACIPYGLFLPHYFQFYMGFILHYLIRNQFIPKSNFLIAFILVLLLGGCCACVIYKSDYLSVLFSVLVGFLFLILHKHDPWLCNLTGVKIFNFLGSFSYSTYLMHIPLWPLIGMAIRNFIPIPHVIAAPLFLVPGIFLLSYVWYLFFEKPSSQWGVFQSLAHPIRTLFSRP